jgi:hypothetical protein
VGGDPTGAIYRTLATIRKRRIGKGQTMTLTPAYGRDYKSKKAVLTDWNAGKDFIIQDILSPWCGKPANKEDLTGTKNIVIRYDKNRKVMAI